MRRGEGENGRRGERYKVQGPGKRVKGRRGERERGRRG
jgi:hypothetical protein